MKCQIWVGLVASTFHSVTWRWISGFKCSNWLENGRQSPSPRSHRFRLVIVRPGKRSVRCCHVVWRNSKRIDGRGRGFEMCLNRQHCCKQLTVWPRNLLVLWCCALCPPCRAQKRNRHKNFTCSFFFLLFYFVFSHLMCFALFYFRVTSENDGFIPAPWQFIISFVLATDSIDGRDSKWTNFVYSEKPNT